MWPITNREEITHTHFEAIRERLFVLRNFEAGYIDLGTLYTAYTWNAAAAGWGDLLPGELQVRFGTGESDWDLYVNYDYIAASGLVNQWPVKDGKLNSDYWRLAPNPNKYHHLDYNAGRPDIEADGRWLIWHHTYSTGGYSPYTMRVKAYKLLPRQVDPYEQVEPVRGENEVTQRHKPVEFKRKHITQDIGTNYVRTDATPPPYPRRMSEYIKEEAEPLDAGSPGQYAYDTKMCEAYQDRVLAEIELSTRFLKEVDDEWRKSWEWEQVPQLWHCADSPGKSWVRGDIVHLGDDSYGAQFYVCVQSHVAITGDCKTPPDEDYWITPAYQPELFRDHPVYVPIGGDNVTDIKSSYIYMWHCNCSAYELLLRTIDSFDWWWDTSYPAVPYWLLKKTDRTTWPLPRGCWRRTWKHSMGRVGAMMWPGERGTPPGFAGPPACFIVSPEVYSQIPEGGSKYYYRTSDVEKLWTDAFSDEEEDLIHQRHGPVQTEYNSMGAAYPEYELHHTLVNDLWRVLQELRIMDSSDLTVQAWALGGACNMNLNAAHKKGTSLAAYEIGREHAESYEVHHNWLMSGEEWLDETNICYVGYECGVKYGGAPPAGYYPFNDYGFTKMSFYIKVSKGDDAAPLNVSSILCRIAYKGIPLLGGVHNSGCVIGFEDVTIYAAPEDPEKNKYAKLKLDAAYSSPWYFDAVILSPWPYTGVGEWFDWDATEPDAMQGRVHFRGTEVLATGQGMKDWIVLETNWSSVPASVFELDESNFIVV